MSETRQQTEQTTAEARIMRTDVPLGYTQAMPRVCLLQIQKAETFTEETEAKRKEITKSLHWDHEDYVEEWYGARPEGTDPKADVRVCGLGGCTLRIFQAEDGTDIQTGECKAADYCLKERFEAVGLSETITEGQTLYKDIITTCDRQLSPMSASNFCPKLNCELSAGTSVDGIPGTAGLCAIQNLVQLEDFEQQNDTGNMTGDVKLARFQNFILCR